MGYCEWVYLYIFTFELVMKIVAYGFVMHKHSYLRDAWCQLDFVVVSLAWLPILFPQFGNLSAVRSVRALRPLRALKRVPGMPVLVGSILQSLPALGNVAGLSAFLFLLFGIIGMNLFKGALHYRCAENGVFDLPNLPEPPETGYTLSRRMLAGSDVAVAGMDQPAALAAHAAHAATAAAASLAATSLPAFKQLLSSGAAKAAAAVKAGVSAVESGGAKASAAHKMPGRALKGGGGSTGQADPDDPEAAFDTETFCAADPDMCLEEGTTCFYFQSNPAGGTVSFDTVALSFIAILQAVTFDTWTDPMFDIMNAYSYMAWIYFIAVAILGGLFVVNLFLAVIFDEFMRIHWHEHLHLRHAR